MHKILLTIGLLILFSVSAFAQNTNPMRIEVPENKVDEVYSLALANKYFIILEHFQKRNSKGEHWALEIYNSDFKKTGNKELSLPREFRLFDHKLSGDSIVWLCFAEAEGKNASTMLYRLNLQTGLMNHAYIKGSRKSTLIGIEVLKNKLFLIGEGLGSIQDQIAEIKLPYGTKIIAPVYPEYSHILASRSYESEQQVVVIVNIQRGSEMGLYYYEFESKEAILTKNKLLIRDNINLLDGSLVESENGELLFMGTYNSDMGRQPTKEMIISEGTYIGKLTDGQFAFFNTNKFSDFVNVFSTLSYKEQMKAKQKISKGKDVEMNFKLLIHEKSIIQGDQYILIVEAYYPEFHYENNFDSRGYMYQMEVFDGYRTTNCIVAAFSTEGKLMWDNYMHISDIRSYTLKENILVFAEADSSIVMAYYSDGDIKSKVVKGNDVVYKKSEDRMETTRNENVITENLGHIEHWYDNYFILSGYQVVIGKNSKKRKVFFFNLISFE